MTKYLDVKKGGYLVYEHEPPYDQSKEVKFTVVFKVPELVNKTHIGFSNPEGSSGIFIYNDKVYPCKECCTPEEIGQNQPDPLTTLEPNKLYKAVIHHPPNTISDFDIEIYDYETGELLAQYSETQATDSTPYDIGVWNNIVLDTGDIHVLIPITIENITDGETITIDDTNYTTIAGTGNVELIVEKKPKPLYYQILPLLAVKCPDTISEIPKYHILTQIDDSICRDILNELDNLGLSDIKSVLEARWSLDDARELQAMLNCRIEPPNPIEDLDLLVKLKLLKALENIG